MSEAKEAIIREDESEGDGTEELYQPVFIKTEETTAAAKFMIFRKAINIYTDLGNSGNSHISVEGKCCHLAKGQVSSVLMKTG